MTFNEAADAVRARHCPACARDKKPWRLVCFSCWDCLKARTRRRVQDQIRERPTSLPSVLAEVLEELGTAFKAEPPCPLCGSLGVLVDGRGETMPCPKCGEMP